MVFAVVAPVSVIVPGCVGSALATYVPYAGGEPIAPESW
jgi:hypothetical protein